MGQAQTHRRPASGMGRRLLVLGTPLAYGVVTVLHPPPVPRRWRPLWPIDGQAPPVRRWPRLVVAGVSFGFDHGFPTGTIGMAALFLAGLLLNRRSVQELQAMPATASG